MFTVEREIPWEELEPQIRETTLLDQPDAYPYAASDIQLREIASPHFDDDTSMYTFPEEYVPIRATTKYVLKENLDFQDRLKRDLNQHGHDQLRLAGGLVLRNTETDEQSVLVPPIIEESREDGYYVLDGAHRIWNDRVRRHDNPVTYYNLRYTPQREVTEVTTPARSLITAIVVYQPRFPSYARPNAWQEVKVVDEVPTTLTDKKDYRTDYPGGYRALYRDFSRLGSSGWWGEKS